MSDIPSDLHCEFLRRVPSKHLYPLRLVCKKWRSIIDDFVFYASLFIRAPTGKLYAISFDSLDSSSSIQQEQQEQQERKLLPVTNIKNMVGSSPNRVKDLPLPSCHEFTLILSRVVTKDWALWNPFTNSPVHSIPHYDGFGPTEKEVRGRGTVLFGLGYDHSTSDYKVVRIAQIYGPVGDRRTRTRLFKTLIYSLKSRAWHRIEDCPFDSLPEYGFRYSPFPCQGVFLKGALHWIGKGDCIVALDLSTESFRKLPLPSIVSPRASHYKYMYLDAHGGQLFLGCIFHPVINSVWILRDYGGENKWTELITAYEFWARRHGKLMRPVAYIESKQQVIVHYDWDKLMWFDVEKKECVKKVTVKGFEVHGFTCQQLPASLAWLRWLNGNCNVADESSSLNRKTMSKRKRVDFNLGISVHKGPEPKYGENRYIEMT